MSVFEVDSGSEYNPPEDDDEDNDNAANVASQEL
jgi:hypothetical protein